jgi:hypothetical protein
MRRWRRLDEVAHAISFRPTWFGARERDAQEEPRDYDALEYMSENPGNVIDQDQTVPLTHLASRRATLIQKIDPPRKIDSSICQFESAIWKFLWWLSGDAHHTPTMMRKQ